MNSLRFLEHFFSLHRFWYLFLKKILFINILYYERQQYHSSSVNINDTQHSLVSFLQWTSNWQIQCIRTEESMVFQNVTTRQNLHILLNSTLFVSNFLKWKTLSFRFLDQHLKGKFNFSEFSSIILVLNVLYKFS